MIRRLGHAALHFRRRLASLLTGPLALALLPAALLIGVRLGGEATLAIATLAVPALLVLAGAFGTRQDMSGLHGGHGVPPVSGRSLDEALADSVRTARRKRWLAACILIELDNSEAIRDAQGAAAAAETTEGTLRQLRAGLRRRDRLFFLGRGRFGIVPAPARTLTPDTAWQMAARLQQRLQGAGVPPTAASCCSVSAGVAVSSESTGDDAAALIGAATSALEEARGFAPATIRMNRPEPRPTVAGPRPLRLHDEARHALETGRITAWFQPQLCTDTGRVSGFEALARWCHPQRGVIPPARFLPYLERAGLTAQLQTVILRDALGALRKWHLQGFDIPAVGVNFSPADLRDVALADIVSWELDRHDLSPSRLAVEILETVVSISPDDATARTIGRLSDLGCKIDLDDFGTGHASISSLRRFAVHRLKIDRSFVTGIDGDQSRQRMVAAILTMADQLELDTLAEGVETAGEHALLAQLGCGHVQGFGIARPMPFDQTLPWLRAHADRLESPPEIGRATG